LNISWLTNKGLTIDKYLHHTLCLENFRTFQLLNGEQYKGAKRSVSSYFPSGK
jgi:hypothetical protein